MKILHTADWHLGIKTDGRDRLDEQRRAIDEIVDISKRENIDIVLISGDIFQHAIPTSDAESLYYEALEKLSDDSKRVVIALAGNHDDPKRIVAGEHFAKKHNVILAGDLKDYGIPQSKGEISVSNSGKGWVEVLKGEEKCVVAILPYPAEYRISEKTKAKVYSEQVAEWAKVCAQGFSKNSFNVFASHMMLVGSSYDRNGVPFVSRVGDVMTVDKSYLPKAHYYAMGHLHTPQFIGKSNNIYYPGAPIALGYQYSDFAVAIVEGNKDGLISHKTVLLKNIQKMKKIKVWSREEAEKLLEKHDDEDLIEIIFVQNEPLSAYMIKELRDKYPSILKIGFEYETVPVDDEEYVVNRKNLSHKDLFSSFYLKKKQTQPSQELVELFLELMEGESSETD